MDLTVLDAGVLIAVLSADDAHHVAARTAMTAARDRGDRLVLPASAYAELLVAPMRQDESKGAAIDEFLAAVPIEVEPASRAIAREAATLRARHGNRLRLPDALVFATATVLEGDRILTTDRRWPTLGVKVELVESAPRSTKDSPA